MSVFLVLLVCSACSAAWRQEFYTPIVGRWKTERGIIVDISFGAGKAVAKVAGGPGYTADSVQAKQALIIDITPTPDGAYVGYFLMPGMQKAVKVRLGLLTKNTLMIATWDKRAKQKTMKWRRLTGAEKE